MQVFFEKLFKILNKIKKYNKNTINFHITLEKKQKM